MHQSISSNDPSSLGPETTVSNAEASGVNSVIDTDG